MKEETPNPLQVSKFNVRTALRCLLIAVGVFAVAAFAVLVANSANGCRLTRLNSALFTATALESAVIQFRTEYGTLPNVGSQFVTTDSPEGVMLLKILLGMEDGPDRHQNARDIKFLSVKEGKQRKKGLIYSKTGTSVEGLFDDYGNAYIVVLNRGHEAALRFPYYKGRMIKLEGRNVAAFSPGKDRRPGTADDARTW